MSSTAPDLADAARSIAERLTDDQALIARALLDLEAVALRDGAINLDGVNLAHLRAAVAAREGCPVGAQRIRRALYGLGATSTRNHGAGDSHVERVSRAVRLVDAQGGHGGASERRYRLTPYALEVLRHRDRLDGLEVPA